MEHTKERRTELLLDSWRDEAHFFQEIDLKLSQNCFHNSSSSILFSTFDNWLFCLEERSIWGQMASDDNPNWGNEVLEPTAPSVNQPSCPANAGTTELTAPLAEDPKNNVDEHFSSNMSREVKLHQPNKEEIETEEAGILLRENILQLKKEILQAKVNQLSLKTLNQVIIRPCDLRERPAKGNMSSLNPNATPWTPSVSLKQKYHQEERLLQPSSNCVSLPSANYPVQENPVFLSPDKIYCKNLVAITAWYVYPFDLTWPLYKYDSGSPWALGPVRMAST